MLVTLVGFAFLFGILISRMGLPPMVGFLVAGFAYNFAGLEAPTGLQLVADLGVTLLLFSIGLKLKLKDLATSEVWVPQSCISLYQPSSSRWPYLRARRYSKFPSSTSRPSRLLPSRLRCLFRALSMPSKCLRTRVICRHFMERSQSVFW